MNILYLAHRIPYPPNKGDKLRAFHQIVRLSQRHRIWCVCFVDDPEDDANVEPLSRYCEELRTVRLDPRQAWWRALLGLLRGGTVTESYYDHAGMTEEIRRLAGAVTFDAVVAFSSSMGRYALQVPGPRRILDLCDLDSEKWLAYAQQSPWPARLLYRAEGKRLGALERRFLGQFDATILITESEADAIDRPARLDRLHIVGNGVPLPEIGESSAPPCGEGPVVGFVGQMDYRPNVDAVCWFVREIWPTIRRGYPQARFRIVGRRPIRAVHRLQRHPGVEVTGAVHDVLKEVLRFDVSVAPIRLARGLQNKVLEAMAAARAVVLTPQAAEGIAAHSGLHFFVADDPTNFAGCVMRLLGDEALRGQVGRRARQFVAARHRWDAELGKFEAIVRGAPARLHRTPTPEPAEPEPTLEDALAPDPGGQEFHTGRVPDRNFSFRKR